ncbi:FtsX-like permease family protein [Calidifontibacter indicus]|uniref:FtsX-like permease family protein n=1 Tax=Calidifontibacter indicus TaxID=419650 RepID=UPI0011C06748|nr:FtsX-like permease family protein [Calidifontibacter indicus]
MFAITMAATLSAMALSRDAVISNRSQELLALKPAPGHPATFLIDNRFQTIGREQVVVITVEPLSAAAPVPPGLDRWPRPGEAALSPSVQRMGAADMFGPAPQTIGIEGLESATDPRVYVRPARGTVDRTQMRSADRFGDDDTSELSSSVGLAFLNRLGMGSVLAGLWGTLGLAGAASLVTAAGMGGDDARRRVRRLAALGASRPQVVAMRWVECAGPIVIGAGLGAAVTTALLWVPLNISWLHEITAPADLRGRPGLLVAAPMIAIVVALIILAAPVWRTLSTRRAGRGRFFTPQDSLPITRSWICVAGIVAGLWIPPLLTGPPRQQAYLLCVAVVACTLSSLVAILIHALGRFLSTGTIGKNSPASLTAGGLLKARPRRTARMLTAVCLAILTLGQVQLSTGLLGSQYHAATAAQRAINDSILISPNVLPTTQVQSYVSTLPTTQRAIWVETRLPERGNSTPTQTFSGSCSSLASLSLPCSSQRVKTNALPPRTRMALASLGGGAVRTTAGSPCETKGRDQCQLLIVSPATVAMSVRDMTRKSTAYVGGGLRLESLAAQSVAGSEPNRIRGRWVVLYGAIALALLIIAMAAMLTSETMSDARRLAALAAVRGNKGWLWQHALLSVLVPIGAAGTFASVAYFVLPAATNSEDARLDPSFTYASAATVISVVVGIAATAVSVRTTRETNPLSVRHT